MFIYINASAIRKEEIRTGFPRNSGLYPPNGFSDGSEFQSSNTSGSQKRREDHVVARWYTNDVIDFGVQTLHEPASSPPWTENHHPRLLMGLCGSQTWILNWVNRWLFFTQIGAEVWEKREGWEKTWVCVSGSMNYFNGRKFEEISEPRHDPSLITSKGWW